MGTCPWHLPQGLCFHSGTLFPLRGGGEMQHVFQAPCGTAGPQSPPPVSTFSLSPVRPWFLPLKCPPAALLGLQKEMVMAGRRERGRAQGPRQEDLQVDTRGYAFQSRGLGGSRRDQPQLERAYLALRASQDASDNCVATTAFYCL